jgi:hypothetical protein
MPTNRRSFFRRIFGGVLAVLARTRATGAYAADFTNSDDTVTTAATLYVQRAPTAGSTNYAIWVDDGLVKIDRSIVVGSPTGGDKGAGTINAQAVYDDNTLLTDFVFDEEYRLPPIEEMEAFFRQHRHLPTIKGRAEWEAGGGFSVGQLATMLWETVEVQARYIAEIDGRLTTGGL